MDRGMLWGGGCLSVRSKKLRLKTGGGSGLKIILLVWLHVRKHRKHMRRNRIGTMQLALGAAQRPDLPYATTSTSMPKIVSTHRLLNSSFFMVHM